VKVQKKNTAYDLDDADYLEFDPSTIFFFAKNCQGISAGSQQIKSYLSKFNSNIVHTTSPIVDLNMVKHIKNPLFTIGWIGAFGGEHKESLTQLVFPALRALDFPFKLILLGVFEEKDRSMIQEYFQNFQSIQLEMPTEVDWNNEVEIQTHILSFDVGIATLTSSELQISKSGIKAKQYMNNGVPVLSSRIAENTTVVIDGFNGFFCDTKDDFKKRFEAFYYMSKDDYGRLSRNARQSIVHFDHQAYLLQIEKLYRP
jgi:glycosyltransferase involved in cell wall biosynthesis